MIIDLSKAAEAELREYKVETPKDISELNDLIAVLAERQHDYGTCVYAMSIAATAAFNYMARKLGVTGFQASCADMDVIKRTRLIDGPFMLIKGDDMLYPQYDIRGNLEEALASWMPWAAEQARLELAKEDSAYPANPKVVAHWEMLASYIPAPESQNDEAG